MTTTTTTKQTQKLAERWPNGLGFNVQFSGALRFEVWPSGSIVRLVADGGALTGWRGEAYLETGERLDKETTEAEAVAIVIAARERLGWKACALD